MARLPDASGCLLSGHWPGPRSLVTTSGVSVDVLSSGYLDISVPPGSLPLRVDLTVGFPHSESTDQSLLAAPHGLSQRVTSFIASQRQGIHQMPLETLDQTVRKGKCRRYKYQACAIRRSYKHFLQDCSHSDRKALFGCDHAIPRSWMSSLTLSNSVPGGAKPGQAWKFGSFHAQSQTEAASRMPAMPDDPSGKLVGTGRFELPTSRLSVVRSNQLSYAPVAMP